MPYIPLPICQPTHFLRLVPFHFAAPSVIFFFSYPIFHNNREFLPACMYIVFPILCCTIYAIHSFLHTSNERYRRMCPTHFLSLSTERGHSIKCRCHLQPAAVEASIPASHPKPTVPVDPLIRLPSSSFSLRFISHTQSVKDLHNF